FFNADGRSPGADVEALLATREPAGAIVAVVALPRASELIEADAARCEKLRIGHDLEGPGVPAEAVDVGHAGNRAQLRADHPLEQRALLLEGQRALDREHEHLAERRGDRGQAA